MQNSVKASFCSFFLHSTKAQPPTSGLWLAADCQYSVMALGCAGSNLVGTTKTVRHVGRLAITINSGKSSRLLSLNQQSYSHGAQFIARAVDGDYLRAAAL